jgi:hypothetical protein
MTIRRKVISLYESRCRLAGPFSVGNMLSYIARASRTRRARSSADFGMNCMTSPMTCAPRPQKRSTYTWFYIFRVKDLHSSQVSCSGWMRFRKNPISGEAEGTGKSSPAWSHTLPRKGAEPTIRADMANLSILQNGLSPNPGTSAGRGPGPAQRKRRSCSAIATSLMLASRRRISPCSSNSHCSLP